MTAPVQIAQRTHPQTHPIFEDPALRYVRVEKPGDEPAPEKRVVDVAVLDMNHRFPNLGHSSIVEVLLTLANQEREALGKSAPHFRVISYEVRGGGAVPAVNGKALRFPLLIGTGGPGALDPRLNDGLSEGAQGVKEDIRWEAALWKLFDRVMADRRAALMGICHSFGLIARWSGVATPHLRTAEQGGKSAGVVKNLLTDEARAHPWFSRFYETAGGPRVEVLDSRLWDLIPTGGSGNASLPLAFAADGPGGSRSDALTMVELAREERGVYPRIWGVNFHPEIGDRGRQRERLARLAQRGEVTPEWLVERQNALEAWNASAATEKCLQTTASFCFEEPVRRVISRALTDL